MNNLEFIRETGEIREGIKNIYQMRQRLDKHWIGILLGLALPALVGWFYIERFNLWYTFENFDWELMKPIIGRICQVGIFPNMAMIFVLYTLETWRLAKGVLIGALPYIVASVGLMM